MVQFLFLMLKFLEAYEFWVLLSHPPPTVTMLQMRRPKPLSSLNLRSFGFGRWWQLVLTSKIRHRAGPVARSILSNNLGRYNRPCGKFRPHGRLMSEQPFCMLNASVIYASVWFLPHNGFRSNYFIWPSDSFFQSNVAIIRENCHIPTFCSWFSLKRRFTHMFTFASPTVSSQAEDVYIAF